MHFTKTYALAVALAMLDIALAMPQNKNSGNTNSNNGNTGNNNNNGNTNTGNTGGDNNAAAGLDLLSANLQSASATDGNPNKTAGQSASLTDKANFINFCSGKTITNGKQITAGSCNGIVMGDMPSQANMVSSIIINPGPGDNIAANTDFKIQVQVANLLAGTFTNPQDSYYAAPQQLSGGKIIGHTHVVIQNLGSSLSPKTPPDAKTFAFFKGIDDDGNGAGLLSATVTGGLPAGNYRVCSMSSSSNHQPVLMPVAQRGAQDDCQKFTVGGNGGNAKANAGTGTNVNGATGAGTIAGTGAGTNNNGNDNQSGNGNGNANSGNNANGSKTTAASNSQSSAISCNSGQNSGQNGIQNGGGNENGQSNSEGRSTSSTTRGDNGRATTSTTTVNPQPTPTTGNRGGSQNVNGEANNNNGQLSSSTRAQSNQQSSVANKTRTTSGSTSQHTGMMDDSGIKNGIAVERRRFQAREFVV